MKMKKGIVFLTLCMLFLGCKKDRDTSKKHFCTEIFAMVTIQVNGGPLDDFFTIRESTGDTLRHDVNGLIEEGQYIVLDDNFAATLKNREETFIFTGIVGKEKVVEEPFVIKADDCHIDYVSGKREVSIE